MGIKTSQDLKKAMQKAVAGDKEILWDIAVYKLYNYYMCIHVKIGSETDEENEILFRQFALEHNELHKEVEQLIDTKLELEGLV